MNTHDGKAWKKRQRQFKAFLRLTVIKVANVLARREGRPTAWVQPKKKAVA